MTTHLPLRKSKTRLPFAALPLSLFILLLAGNRATAQCDTFFNADATNQALYTFPYPDYPQGLAFIDIDNDGDLDCYVFTNSVCFNPLENKGNAKHPLFDYTQLSYFCVYPHTEYDNWFTKDFDFADLNGDGDQDLFLSQIYSYSHGTSVEKHDTGFFYWQNMGTPTAADLLENEEANPLPVFLRDSLRGGLFTLYDIDKDGDLDFTYVSSLINDYKIYLNTGSKATPVFTYYAGLTADERGKPQYFDWNSDGLPDLLLGETLYMNTGTLAHPSFTRAATNPVFTNGFPYILTDLNADGQPEAYTYEGNLSTTAPVPVIDTTVQKIGLRSFVKYYSRQQLPGYQYSWTYNGKPVAGYHRPFIFAEKQGVYMLEITDACGTGISLPHFTYNRYQASQLFTNDDSRQNIALQPQTAVASVSAYPNPFYREVLVRLPQGNKKSTVIIMDVAGRMLLKQSTAATTLSIGSSLPRGMYLLQVWQSENCVYRTRILKQ